MGPRSRRPTSGQLLNERVGSHSLSRGRGLAAHRPAHVYLQVASGCNLDCYMCSEHLRPPEMRHGRGLISLPPELFERIAQEVFPYSCRLTIGMGGEPTLSPHFLQFVERAFEANQEITVLTNGTRLDQPRMAATLARCVSLLQVSLDGATRETYERIRLGSHWNAMRAKLALLNEHRLRYPPESRTRLSFQYVLMRSNVHEMPAFVDLAREFHADRIEFQHVIPVTEEGEREPLIDEPERFNHFRELALRRARELALDVLMPAPYPVAGPADPAAPPAPASPPARAAPPGGDAAAAQPDARTPLARHAVPCSMPTMQVFVFYDGRVFPCCHPYAHRKMQIGDLRTQSFGEIWNSRIFRNLRAGLMSGDVPDICRACSIVHDPPPLREEPGALESAPDLSQHYGERDLDPVDGRATELFKQLAETGLLDYVAHLEAVAAKGEAGRDTASPHPPPRLERILRRLLPRGPGA